MHRRPGDRHVHVPGRQAGCLLEGDARQADHRGGGRAVLDSAAAALAVGLRRGVVGPGAGIGDSRAGVARRGYDDRLARVRGSTEGVQQVVGRDLPRVRREIDERVDQRPARALLGESADQAVEVDTVGGAEIDHTEHRLVRKQSRGGQGGHVGRLERGPLRERVPPVVVRHAQNSGRSDGVESLFGREPPGLGAATTIVPQGRLCSKLA